MFNFEQFKEKIWTTVVKFKKIMNGVPSYKKRNKENKRKTKQTEVKVLWKR